MFQAVDWAGHRCGWVTFR